MQTNSEQAKTINALLQLLQNQQDENKALKEKLDQMFQQIQKLQHLIFGQRSERRPKEKKDEPLVIAKDETPKVPNNNLEKVPRKNKQQGGGRNFPEDLERKIITHELPKEKQICPCCKGNLE